jgi:hypothetical protein
MEVLQLLMADVAKLKKQMYKAHVVLIGGGPIQMQSYRTISNFTLATRPDRRDKTNFFNI